MKPKESFTGQPIRSLQTMLRVIAEDDSRLPTVVPDGVYGPSTMIAITAFQRREGIPVTGITDQTTWDRIVAAYEPARIRVGKAEPIEILLEPGQIIVFGESNPYLYLAQGMLAQLSKEHETIILPTLSGILDADTANALREFQILTALPPTGNLDRITWKHLSHQFTLNAARNNASRIIENNL